MGKKYTEDELNSCSKEMLVTLLLSMQDQVERLNQNMEALIEQINIANQNRFGRKSEKNELPDGQLNLFNEAEWLSDTVYAPEPAFETVVRKRPVKKKGKREEDLGALPVNIITHELSVEKLHELFGEKWKRLPDEVYKRLEYIPASFEVNEHHVAVYAGMDNQTIIKADRPVDIFRNSIVTPSLLAAITNGKYVLHLPYNRMEQEFERTHSVYLSRQLMASWIIRGVEHHLDKFYDYLHSLFLQYHSIHADETDVLVSKDGRSAGASSFMWVYRTGVMSKKPPIVLYDYQKTRSTEHPRTFLKDYKGIVVTDGYQVYHKLDMEEELRVAGCWAHARRRFSDVVKSLGAKGSRGTLAQQALDQISSIYKVENTLSTLSPEERLNRRQLLVRPLVEAYFTWVKEQVKSTGKGSTLKGLEYSINQEKYLSFLN
jgi:transposase